VKKARSDGDSGNDMSGASERPCGNEDESASERSCGNDKTIASDGNRGNDNGHASNYMHGARLCLGVSPDTRPARPDEQWERHNRYNTRKGKRA